MTRRLHALTAVLTAALTLTVTLALLAYSPASQAAGGELQLKGNQVAGIVEMFLRNHYSNPEFGDAESQQMLNRYLRQYDPGHYYFTRADIQEFQQYATKIDDQVKSGNDQIAFLVHKRFLARMAERDRLIKRLLDEPMDLKADDTQLVDRSEAPYPATEAEAEQLWRRRLKFEMLELTISGKTVEEGRETLGRRYKSAHWRVENYTDNDVLSNFLNAFTRVYDPHSSYMSPDELENFNISLRLSLDGIGATLRWEDGLTIISSIIPGGAAAREGTLKAEDKIIAVGQGAGGELEDVRNHRLIDVVKLIRGQRGSKVRIAFLRKNGAPVEKRLEVVITRDKIELKEGEAKSEVIDRPRQNAEQPLHIGVVQLPSFYVDFSQRRNNPDDYKSASKDVSVILQNLQQQGVDGLILDLRNNGGGGLDEAVSLAGMFLNQGPIVMVKDLRGRVSVLSNPHEAPLFTRPMLVLVNRYSASASEIVAGALKDYGRAIVVGDRATFGKGTVQNIINLPGGTGALKTTVAKFYRPGSASTQHRGVEADIVLPSLNNYLEIGESSLDNALPWDSVRRPAFRTWGDLDPMLPVLSERSRQRVGADPQFQKVEAAVQDYVANRKDRKEITVQELLLENKERTGTASEAAPHAEEPATEGDALEKDYVLQESANILRDLILLSDQPGTRIAIGRG